jgi:hypothetical protein
MLSILSIFLLVLIIGCDDDDDDAVMPPTPTVSPTPPAGESYTCQKGKYKTYSFGNKPSGKFYFEAKGFVEEKYPGDESWMKPVFFWLFNDHSGFDYNGSGLLIQVFQLMHAGYYCQGGKMAGRNHGRWLEEVCWMTNWKHDRWYSFEFVWGNGYMTIFVDGKQRARMHTQSISGAVSAGIGWPPVRREGLAGLKYRNIGYE